MNFDYFLNKFKKNAPLEVLGIKINPEALAYIKTADKFFQDNNYPQAIVYYTKAINIDPKNCYPLTKRGNCYKMIQQYDKAIEDLFKSVALDDNFENNQSIAECQLFKKDFSSAVKYFDKSLIKIEEIEKIDTGEMSGRDYGATKARTLNNQAYCYFNMQQIDKAIDCSTKGIKANPNYPNNYCIRGIVYLQKGNRSEAIRDLQNASRLGDQRANSILSEI
jgi:tetratricopeptide (TPR) repeat protein